MPSVTYSSSKPSAPESITILTSGNYTVPAGKSAKISAICNGSATVSLDGQVVLTGATWSTMVSNLSPQMFTASKSVPSGFGGNYTVTGRGLNSGSTFMGSFLAFNNQVGFAPISASDNISNASVTDAFTNSTAQSALSASYTVPAGTVIATSGGRCVIEIYSA